MATTVTLLACGVSTTDDSSSAAESVSVGVEERDTNVSAASQDLDPFSLEDLQDAYTIDAPVAEPLLSETTISGDLYVSTFGCPELIARDSRPAIFCVEGGTVENPFALVVGDERLRYDNDTQVTTIFHSYSLYRSVKMPGDRSIRAEVVGFDDKMTELDSFFNMDLTVFRMSTPMGDAIVLRRTLFGPSRRPTWITIIGANAYGSPAVVATHAGEGIEVYSDNKGLVVSGYRYAYDEPLCCPSLENVYYLRPGRNGWTRSTRTFPRNDGQTPGAVDPFADFTELEQVFEYSMPHGTP